MIVTTLQGGLGNQLFQYAMGLAQAKRFNTTLGLDITSFERCSIGRRYSLDLFQGTSQHPIYDHYRYSRRVTEKTLLFDPRLLRAVGPSCTLVGYWQSERYFDKLREELNTRLLPKDPPRNRAEWDVLRQHIQGTGPSVFVTVRRTDYVGNDYHGLLGPDYYREAVAHLRDLVGEDLHLWVFSDDPEWCLNHFLDGWLPGEGEGIARAAVAGNWDRTTRDHKGREDLELMLMRYCQHAICANSSYSWWGAWLGADRTGGRVIAPARWFGPDGPNDQAQDICPERWIRL